MANIEEPCHLSRLPPEIIDTITEFLHPKDLLNLRLINKEFATRTEKSMGRKCFSNLIVFLARPSSLQRALNVVQHSTLRNFVRKTYVALDDFTVDVLERPHLLRTHHVSHVTRSGTKTKWNRYRQYIDWIEEQEQLVHDGEDRRKLHEIFVNLEKRNQDIKIAVGEIMSFSDVPNFLAKDYKSMKQAYNAESWEEQPWSSATWGKERPMRIVLDGLAAADLRPAWFHMEGINDALSMDLLASHPAFDGRADTFANLTSLELNVQARPDAECDEVNVESVHPLESFLQRLSSQLIELDLRMSFPPEPEEWPTSTELQDYAPFSNSLDLVFSTMAEKMTFPKLTSLEFYCLWVRYDQLLKFLTRHKATLTEISLDEVYAMGPGSVSDYDESTKHLRRDLERAGVVGLKAHSTVYFEG